MSDINKTAADYIAAGWSVVPIKAGTKKGPKDYNKTTYEAKHFKDGDNIAGKYGEPSGHRTDVDLDAPEAIEGAQHLLRDTGLIHGRPGKPRSHHWYRCEGAKTEAFTDVKGADGKDGPMLVEIRSTGGYTVLPPSVHPSGDVLAWESEQAPPVMTPEELRNTVVNIAITALVARHWNALTHVSMGHLAGFLLQAKLSSMRVRLIFETLGTMQPTFKQEILALAQNTIDRFNDGEPVTGGPKLTEALGKDVVDKMRYWLKLVDTDAIEEMNRRHFVTRLGAMTVIGREDDPSGIVVFQDPKALHTEYRNRQVMTGSNKKGDPILKTLDAAWLDAPNRRKFRSVVFQPPPIIADERDYNLWQGYAVTPDDQPDPDERCPLFLNHLFEVVCSGNAPHYEYLLNLLALTAQEPGTPTGVATVLRGKEGCGKGVFARTIGDLFGRRHFAHLDKTEQFTGHFNAALSGKIVVFADEAFWAGDKREVGALKRLITEPTLRIERKGFDSVDETNHVHLFMATNERWSWPASIDDRRGFLLKVSDKKKDDKVYFAKLFAEIAHGGKEALLAFLLAQPIDRMLLLNVPKTAERAQQQIQSLEPMMRWWSNCLYAGEITARAGWPTKCLASALYEGCVASIRGHAPSLNQVVFGQTLRKFFTAEKEPMATKRGREYKMRTLSDARRFWNEETGITIEWEGQRDDDLLTEASY